MDQSESNKKGKDQKSIEIPRRGFTVELLVGIFAILGLGALGFQAIGLAGVNLFPSSNYQILAEFDNVSGLKHGASVEIAGVQIGTVTGIELSDPTAIITLDIRGDVRIFEGDIAAVRTQGLIGDRYVKISRGASESPLEPGDLIFDTESVVDIEDIISKIVHSLSGDDEEPKTATVEGIEQP